MHERNIYKIPHNFAELARKHEFLAPFLSLSSNGVPKINFKDHAALKALTKALLLEDFQLAVEIPDDVLIPTVPLRLNYILWLEDLLTFNDGFGKEEGQVSCLDVGTGATAIYALLGAKKNRWRMIGTEIDPESVMLARANVKRNGLEKLIEIQHVKESVLRQVLADSEAGKYEFTMCNPPFFGNEDEADSAQKSKKDDRPEPSGAKSGTKGELIVSGGEYEFICQMIDDSKAYPNSVKIFTTMIGIKKHVKDLLAKLKAEGITNVTTTEFSQGKTMRWGLAWSFNSEIHLQSPPQVTYVFENIPGCLNFENYMFEHLKNLKFRNLEWIPVPFGSDEMTSQNLHFAAVENTWTGQRRKRREMERLKKLEKAEPPKKVSKIEQGNDQSQMQVDGKSTGMQSSAQETLLDGQIEIIREGSQAKVAMRLLGGSLGKDGLNQIMTYLKNSYNRDANNPTTELYQLLTCEK